jgi:glycosyltransferase involved in cell wall biosynthesis
MMGSPVVLHIDTGRTFRGGQRQLLLLSERLKESGVRQIIACPHNSQLSKRIKDIPVVDLSDHSLIRKMSCGSLIRTIDEYAVNIVHAHDSEAHSLGIRIKIKHSEIRLVVNRRVVFTPSGRISRRFKYRRYVDQYIAISRAVAESLRDIGVHEESISVIPSGLDISKIISTPPDNYIKAEQSNRGKFIMISAGALTSEKNFETAIKTAQMVKKTAPEVVLVILGDGPEKSRLKDLAVKESIRNVRFLGHREPMAPIFKACDLFLLTSISEGLNSSAIEAAACGLPLVVSNVGGLPEIAEKGYNGLLCEPGRPESFAKAILDLYKDPEVRKKMAGNSISKAKHFDIERSVQKTVQLYNRLLAE